MSSGYDIVLEKGLGTMRNIHRGNSAERQHYTIDRQSFIKINPTLLYSGSLHKIQDWKDSSHSHEFLEIIFITDGMGIITIDDMEYTTQKGDIIIYNAGVTHYEHSSTNAPMEACFIAFDKVQLEGMPPNCILPPDAGFIFQTGDYAAILVVLFDMIKNEISSKDEFYAEIAKDASHALLMYIFRLLNQNNSSVELPHKDPVLQSVLDFIDQNFLREIGLQEISEECFINKFYLSHLFAEHLNMSVGGYIRKKRIDLAKQLLEDGSLSVCEISDQCAFNDSNYFSRTFKKITHLTPLQYQKTFARKAAEKECKCSQ